MHDDEAAIRLKGWATKVAGEGGLGGQASSFASLSEISTSSGVPEDLVSRLISGVLQDNYHLGVTATQLKDGKFHVEAGPRSIRDVYSTRRR